MAESETTRTGVERRARSSYVAVALHEHPESEPSLLESVPERLRNALGVSVVIHAVVAAFLLWAVTAGPVPEVLPPQRDEQIQLVYLGDPGPGGGGGGGGAEQEEAPRRLELPGPDAVSIPTEKPPPVDQPPEVEPPDPEPLKPEVNVPVLSTASSMVDLAGVALEQSQPTMSLGSGRGGGGGEGEGGGAGVGRGTGIGEGTGGGMGGGVYRGGAGIEIPRVLREVQPQYTPEAMRARIQGTVWLECIVTTEGRCTNVRVTRSLDARFGLDQEAIKAAQQWEFEPGRKQDSGTPVPVIVTVGMDFTLR